jgi:hypothetical protein
MNVSPFTAAPAPYDVVQVLIALGLKSDSAQRTAAVAPLSPPVQTAPVSITVIGKGHPRQLEFCQKIAELSSFYAAHHDYIIPQSVESLIKASNDGHLLVGLDPQSGAFVAAVQLKPLLLRERLGLPFDILEVGTLLKDTETKLNHIGFHLVKACAQWAKDHDALLIGTSRNARTSGAAFKLGGFEAVPWQASGGLSALTCDPTCQSTDAGPAWIGCNGSVQCGAMAGVGVSRSDACVLYVSNSRHAYEVNEALERIPSHLDAGKFSSRALRVSLGMAV